MNFKTTLKQINYFCKLSYVNDQWNWFKKTLVTEVVTSVTQFERKLCEATSDRHNKLTI